MSKLGYIYSSYGKQFNVCIANTYSTNVLLGSNLPSNSLIICAPTDSKGNDIGEYSVVATDSEGVGVRLTYNIIEGNGLHFKDDYLSIDIDNRTIVEKDAELSVNINSIIDDNTIKNTDYGLSVDPNGLTKASKNYKGVFKVDGKTLSVLDGTLSVNTANLEYSNNSTGTYGIVGGDGKTVIAKQGILSVQPQNLDKPTQDRYGLVNSNDPIIEMNDGILSIKTEFIRKATSDLFGIAKPDNSTVILNSNNELTLNDSSLQKASNEVYGIFKIDPNIFSVEDSRLSIPTYDKTKEEVDKIKEKCDDIKNKINNIKYLLTEYASTSSGSMIRKFYCSQSISRVLIKPKIKDESTQRMKNQFVSAEFIINTNCPFTISVLYSDNPDPQISLYEINYNNVDIYKGTLGLGRVYQTTEERDVHITFTFLCKNFASLKNDYSINTKIKITASSILDVGIYKTVNYSITRFNSMYKEDLEYKDNTIDYYDTI